ncbi:LptF/LptG family permease [Flammeovirgaceae bacterium SG7u.111]|nr:LptF/LptG family permease [Flammeovirgaceae bacterium SG7u.132]WPO37387.1 LptF/LptG family permease [Flammeovirgaceae bacterium SG7u.111]
MKILDRYILKKFFVTFFFVVLILIAVICVIDYTEKSGDFLKNNLTFAFILKEYYLNYIPYMANTLSPIAVFITVVFVTSKMASHSEIIAILSSGVSFRRLIGIYVFGACILAAVTFYLVGWVIPKAAAGKVKFEVKYVKGPFYYDARDIHFRTSDSTYVYMQHYNNRVKTGFKFTLEKIKEQELLSKMSADKIVWDSTLQKWHIDKYEVYEFDGKKEKKWEGTNLDTALNVLPKYFENDYHLEETFTFEELDRFIAEQKLRGVGDIERFLSVKYERYAYPFAIIILTAMGVILSARKSRQGTGMQIAIGFMLAFVYIIFFIMSRNLAQKGGFDPMLAAWIPNIIFTFITTFMYFTVPR